MSSHEQPKSAASSASSASLLQSLRSLYGMHSRFISLMKSKGLTLNPMRLLITGILMSNPISIFLMGLRILLMGSMNAPLTMVSMRVSSATATLSRIIIMMSGAEHSCSSLGRLSIHAGRSSMKTCAIARFNLSVAGVCA